MASATHFSNTRGNFLAPLTSWFHSVREQLARQRNYRRTLNELSMLSTYQLADLGLHRASLRRAAHNAVYHQIR
ncbi:MAG: DUF1127 domain-containing protein [Rhodobacteraceae bacterium]|nr:DUF1127 domain-containing protein [Paracoccaceae bacterium]